MAGPAAKDSTGRAVKPPDPGAEWDAAQKATVDTAALGDEWQHANAGDPGAEWDRTHQQKVDTAGLGSEWDQAHAPPAPQPPTPDEAAAAVHGLNLRRALATPTAPADPAGIAGIRRGEGRTLHGQIASGLLGFGAAGPLQQAGQDIETFADPAQRAAATTGQKALAGTRLALTAATPFLGWGAGKLAAKYLPEAGEAIGSLAARLGRSSGAGEAVAGSLGRAAGEAAAPVVARAAAGAPLGAASSPAAPFTGAAVGAGLGAAGGAEGPKEMHSIGLSLTPGEQAALGRAGGQAFTSPGAALAGTPEAEIGNAVDFSQGAHRIPEYIRQQGERSMQGLTPEQRTQASRLISLDNYEDKAARNQAAADRIKASSEGRLQQDLEAADKHAQAGRAVAQQAARMSPSTEPANVDVTAEQRATTGRQQEEIGSEVQAQLDQTQQEAEAMRTEAQRAHQERMDNEWLPMQEAAHNHKVLADRLRTRVDPSELDQGTRTPAITDALTQWKQRVTPIQERFSLGAGVDPADIRQPAGGIYQRAIPADRQREIEIARTQQAAEAAKGGPLRRAFAERTGLLEGNLKPRTGLALDLLGQKRNVLAATPVGAEAPPQGPIDIGSREGGGGPGILSTQRTGAARHAAGTADQYIEDDAVASAHIDAQDKATKAANNRVLQSVANRGRELGPNQSPAPGEREIAFTNTGQIIDNPLGYGDKAGLRRFAVSKEAGDLLSKHRAQMIARAGAPSQLGAAARGVSDVATGITLGNPAVAPFHAFREASAVGTNAPPDANLAQKLAGVLPGYSGAETLARIRALDMNSPEAISAQQHGAEYGWLRIEDPRAEGRLGTMHNWLFGPEGIDRKLRVRAFLDFKADRASKGLSTSGTEFDAAARNYVVTHTGEPHAGARGELLQKLSATQPFVQTHAANIGTGLRAAVGEGGLTNATAGQRLATLARGPVGKIAAAGAITTALSGHKPQSADLEPGLYHEGGKSWADPSSYHHMRGNPDEARAQYGPGTKEITIRDPGMPIVGRILANTLAAPPGHQLTEAARGVTNAALGMATGPAAGAAFGLATGKIPYINRQGDFASEEGEPQLKPDEGLRNRLKAAGLSLNSGLAAALGEGASSSVSGLLPFLSTRPAKDFGLATQLRDPGDYIKAVGGQISAAKGNPDEINRAADAAIARLGQEKGLNQAYYQAQINKLRNRALLAPTASETKLRLRNPDIR